MSISHLVEAASPATAAGTLKLRPCDQVEELQNSNEGVTMQLHSSYGPVTDQLRTSYGPVTDQLHSSYEPVTTELQPRDGLVTAWLRTNDGERCSPPSPQPSTEPRADGDADQSWRCANFVLTMRSMSGIAEAVDEVTATEKQLVITTPAWVLADAQLLLEQSKKNILRFGGQLSNDVLHFSFDAVKEGIVRIMKEVTMKTVNVVGQCASQELCR